MLLTIDIGNTLIDFGIWDGEELTCVYKCRTKPIRSLDEYRSVVELFIMTRHLEKEKIDRAIISSVVSPLSPIFRSIVSSLFGVKAKILGPRLKTGLAIKTDNPQEVGADLVADSIGAVSLYGGNLFIADLGTANKFIYIDENESFGGCAIAPGLGMGATNLSKEASALPEVNLLAPDHVIGKNTHDSMNAGIIFTNIYSIEGFASSFEKEAGRPLKRILTGGNAVYVKKYLPEFAYEDNLLLLGLKEIDKRNKK